MAKPSEADIAAGVPANEDIVARVPAPSGKGELLLSRQGGVFDTGGTSFSGSYFSLPAEARQGGARTFRDIIVDPKTGGYKIVTDTGGGPTEGQGSGYDFGPSEFVRNMPRANPLYSDPAFLAYLANSGRSYEIAAQDVQRRKAAIEGALSLDIPGIKQRGQENLGNVYKGFASRGLYGAGQQAEEEGKVQSSTTEEIGRREAEAAGQIESLATELAKKRQDILAESATRGYDVAGQQEAEKRLKEVEKKYPLGEMTGVTY